MAARAELALLLRLDGARLRAQLRRPHPGPWLGLLLPLALLAAGAWAAGAHVRPRVRGAEDAVLLGLLVSGAISYLAYPVLFRPADDSLLRRLGLSAGALYAQRAARLLALSAGVALFFLLPFAAGGVPLTAPLVVGAGAALAAWGSALPALSRAARRVGEGGRPGLSARMMGPDPELVSTAPLVYAPLLPLLAGALAAGSVGAAPGAALPAVAALSALLVVAGARPFSRALPRFAARAGEMAFERPPAAGEETLVVRRGVWRLLPATAAAARARDALVVERRFRWAGRVVWPVAAGAVVALLRWGDAEGVRSWVAAAGGAVLAVQGMALVALGRGERGNTRWMDRALGLGAPARLAGRWAAGVGLAAWLAVPLALAWGARSTEGIGWGWLGAALLAPAAAAAVSLGAAGR